MPVASPTSAPIDLRVTPEANANASPAMVAFLANVQRADVLMDNMRDLLLEVQTRNQTLEALTTLNQKITAMKNMYPADAKPDFDVSDIRPSSMQIEYGTLYDEAQAIARANGFTIDIDKFAKLGSTGDNVKARIDSLSNTNQMDLLRLQQLQTNSNQALSLTSEMTQAQKGVLDQIIQALGR